VAKQLTAVFEKFRILDHFHRAHATKTALLTVANATLMQSDAGEFSVLLMLGLTSAFGTSCMIG